MKRTLVASIGAALLIAAGCVPPPEPPPELCTPGTFSATGEAPCTPAPAGTFVDVEGATEATPCPVGTFQAQEGQTECDPAPPGTFVDVEGATEATLCPAGSTTQTEGATSVDHCLTLLAVAYSNLDGIDGYDPTSTDVLIAQLLDTNGDGAVTANDTLQTNRYPLNLDATAFGTFQTTTHAVDEFFSPLALPELAEVYDASGNQFSFEETGQFERYSERFRVEDATYMIDYISLPAESFPDFVIVPHPSPSDPDIPVGYQEQPRTGDDPFLDVDILY